MYSHFTPLKNLAKNLSKTFLGPDLDSGTQDHRLADLDCYQNLIVVP